MKSTIHSQIQRLHQVISSHNLKWINHFSTLGLNLMNVRKIDHDDPREAWIKKICVKRRVSVPSSFPKFFKWCKIRNTWYLQFYRLSTNSFHGKLLFHILFYIGLLTSCLYYNARKDMNCSIPRQWQKSLPVSIQYRNDLAMWSMLQ